MSITKVFSTPELVTVICEQLDTIDISDFRAACRTTEVNSRNVFARKAFQEVCIACTEPGLRRLLNIAQCKRLSGALRSLVFFHADFIFEVEAMQAFEEEFAFVNRAFYKRKWLPFKHFVSVQRRFFAKRADEKCIRRALFALKHHSLPLSISITGVRLADLLDDDDFETPHIPYHEPRGYDIERVTTLLHAVGEDFFTLDDAPFSGTTFDQVFVSVAYGLMASGLTVESLDMPRCEVNGDLILNPDGSLQPKAAFMAKLQTLDVALAPEFVCSKHEFDEADISLSFLSQIKELRKLTLRLDPLPTALKPSMTKYLSGLLRQTVLDHLEELTLSGDWYLEHAEDWCRFLSKHSQSLTQLSVCSLHVNHGRLSWIFKEILNCEKLQCVKLGSMEDSEREFEVSEVFAEWDLLLENEHAPYVIPEDDMCTVRIERPAIKHCMDAFVDWCDTEE